MRASIPQVSSREREGGVGSWLWIALTMGSLRPALLVLEKL